MQNYTMYSLNEIIALVTAVAMGTGAYLGFIVLKKRQKTTPSFIFWITIINLFVTHLVSELLKVFQWGEYRSLALPIVAYAGQYFMEWFDKRYLRIFDTGAKKVGFDINKDNNQDDETADDKQEDGHEASE